MLTALLAAAALAHMPASGQAAPREVVADVRVQGNAATPDEEVIRLAGIQAGAFVDADTAQQVEARLNASGRFQHVQVLKRFASIADPSQILLIIVVDEGPLKIEGEGASARIVRSRARPLFLPVLGYEDGYGFSYGARVALPHASGSRRRLSFPLTWGADRRAEVDLEQGFAHGPLTRILTSASISRRTNPFFEEDDDRVLVSFRGERDLSPAVRIGAGVSWNRVTFGAVTDRFREGGVDLTVDTRLDPMLARNAVYARVGWSRAGLPGGAANRTELEGRGYLGLLGQTILVVRAVRQSSDRALPPYLQPLLGGAENLRGFPAGMKAGDTLVAGSGELRLPLTSPLSLGKLGVSAFADVGTVYGSGERFRDQTLDRGVGGGVWLQATVVRFALVVAHGIGGSTRVHFSTGMTW